jgi:hypothetical protein
MKEFGSDFHFYTDNEFYSDNHLHFSEARYYANGRQAIQDLIQNNQWKRIWIPEYFCYEIIEAIKKTGIQIKLYLDAPTTLNDNYIINEIPFEKDDVLLRMNYFGLRTFRDNSTLPVPVIEDHSHDIIGNWAKMSNADWCFASLRKTLPIPEGGILWSPKNKRLPKSLQCTLINELLSYKRLFAMLLKKMYISNEINSKEQFRSIFTKTETAFSVLEYTSISEISYQIYNQIDIKKWYYNKKENWKFLYNSLNNKIHILNIENIDLCEPFSIILQFENHIERETIVLPIL